MTKQIALLVDSAMDMPQEIIDLGGIYTIPLCINYSDATYLDKVDITPEEIYQRLDKEIPTTSLPPLDLIDQTIRQIKQDGYQEILAINISSGLSGTFNAIRLALLDHPDIISKTIDTKSIGIGAGIQAVYAKELIDKHYSLDSIYEICEALTHKEHIFFSIPTLEYLKKGGRIGLVTSIVGTALNLNPVISCNDDGVYHTVAKTRGRKKSLKKMIDLVKKQVEHSTDYRFAVAYGTDQEDAQYVFDTLKNELPNYSDVYFDTISPVLGAHTGPEVVGVTILDLN